MTPLKKTRLAAAAAVCFTASAGACLAAAASGAQAAAPEAETYLAQAMNVPLPPAALAEKIKSGKADIDEVAYAYFKTIAGIPMGITVFCELSSGRSGRVSTPVFGADPNLLTLIAENNPGAYDAQDGREGTTGSITLVLTKAQYELYLGRCNARRAEKEREERQKAYYNTPVDL